MPELFVLGGAFEVTNLWAVDALEALVPLGGEGPGAHGSGEHLLQDGQQSVDVPADVAVVQVEEHAQNVHGEVLTEVEQRHEEALGKFQLVGASTTDGSNTIGTEQRAPTGAIPLGLKVSEQDIELVGGQADEALEGTGPAFQHLDAQHAPNLPHTALITQRVFILFGLQMQAPFIVRRRCRPCCRPTQAGRRARPS